MVFVGQSDVDQTLHLKLFFPFQIRNQKISLGYKPAMWGHSLKVLEVQSTLWQGSLMGFVVQKDQY
jgi:hypothetical protein